MGSAAVFAFYISAVSKPDLKYSVVFVRNCACDFGLAAYKIFAKTSVNTSVSTLVNTPVKASVNTPVNTSVNAPVYAPVTTSGNTSVNTPVK